MKKSSNKKGFLCILPVVALMVAFMACSTTGLAAAADAYFPDEDDMIDKITVAASSDGATLYPGSARFGQISLNVYQYLGVQDENGDLQLQLLKSVNQIDDLSYECELWDFIYDTNGVNMKASDIEYCCDRYLYTDGYFGSFNKLDYIEVTGDYTFIWHCTEPFALGEMTKNFSGQPMFTQESIESTGTDEFGSTAIGTGPYMISNYVSGSSLTLVPNEDFWMRNIDDEEWLEANWNYNDEQNVKEVEVDIVSDASTRAMSLEMGTLDAADAIDIIDAEYFEADPSLGIDVYTLENKGSVGMYFNAGENSPMQDVNLRKAVCYAIDNEKYADACSAPSVPAYGLLQRMYDAPENWTTGEDREYYSYDPDMAMELIADSSYNGETIEILYNSSAATALSDVAVMMQADLKDVGINAELLPTDMSMLDSVKSDFNAWDIQLDTLNGGSNYLYACLSRFWTEDSAAHMGGLQVMGTLDEHLDELYVALEADDSDENIEAYDDYFSYEMCYGYSVLCYDSTLGGSAKYNVPITATNTIAPGAFTLKEE